MAFTGIPKAAIWGIRFFQLAFAIILLGVLSYIIDEFREFRRSREPPREVIIPEVFSILAIIFTTFGIVAIFFFGCYAQLVAAFLDFCVWVGYLISAGVLRHNYHIDGNKNSLEWSLNAIRRFHGARGHQSLNRHIVGLVSALVVVQTILYFCTATLSVLVALKPKTAAPAGGQTGGQAEGYPAEEKRARFSFPRVFPRVSGEKWVPLSEF